MSKISETNIIEAVIKTNKALSKGKYEDILTAWNELDNILNEDLSHIHSKIIDNAVDVFQTAGLTLCELKQFKLYEIKKIKK